MPPATLPKSKRPAQAAADPIADPPSSSSSRATFFSASTSSTANKPQETPARPCANKTTHPRTAENTDTSASSSRAKTPPSYRVFRPPTNDDKEFVCDHVEMEVKATGTEGVRNSGQTPVPSHEQNLADDHKNNDNDDDAEEEEEEEEEEKEVEEVSLGVTRLPLDTASAPSTTRTARPLTRSNYDNASNLAYQIFLANPDVLRLYGDTSDEANARYYPARLAAQAEADADAAALPTTKAKPPVPICPPRRLKVCPPLPSSLPPPITPQRNLMPYPFTNNPSAYCMFILVRTVKGDYQNKRKLEFTDMRLRWTQLIGNSRLRFSVTADGEEGEFVPVAYRGGATYVTESVDENESDSCEDSENEYVYEDEETAPFMGAVGGTSDMTINDSLEENWAGDEGSEDDSDFEDENDRDDGFDGEYQDDESEFWKIARSRVFLPMRPLKRRRGGGDEYSDDSDDESEDEQEQPKMPLRKKQRTSDYYEGSDEDTPLASASQAEQDMKPKMKPTSPARVLKMMKRETARKNKAMARRGAVPAPSMTIARWAMNPRRFEQGVTHAVP